MSVTLYGYLPLRNIRHVLATASYRKSKSSETWCYAFGWVVPDVSTIVHAFILAVSILIGLFHSEDEGTKSLESYGNARPPTQRHIPKDLYLQQSRCQKNWNLAFLRRLLRDPKATSVHGNVPNIVGFKATPLTFVNTGTGTIRSLKTWH